MSQSFTGLTCRDACASKYGVLQVTLRHIAWYWMTCTSSILWYSIWQFGIFWTNTEVSSKPRKKLVRYEFDWKRDLVLKANSLCPFVPGVRSPHINGPFTSLFNKNIKKKEKVCVSISDNKR